MTEAESGQSNMILTSPEAIIDERWLTYWKKMRHRIGAIVCDEVHCVPLWSVVEIYQI